MRKSSTNYLGLITLFCCIIQINALADCTIGNSIANAVFDIPSYGTQFVAQPFKACETNPIKSISFQIEGDDYQALNAEVRIIAGNLTNIIQGSGFLLGNIDIIPTSNGNTNLNFIPENIYSITGGNEYTWWIEMNVTFISPSLKGAAQARSGGLDFSRNSASTDTNLGNAFDGCLDCPPLRGEIAAGSRMPNALLFNLVQATNTPIPTMTQWGLGIFALVILNLGIFLLLKLEMN